MPKINLLCDDVNIRIWKMTSGIIETNTYIISDSFKNCFLVDAAPYFDEEFQSLKTFLNGNQLIPAYILNTHGHFDHISGVDRLRGYYNIPIIISDKDAEMLMDSELNRSAMLSLDIKVKEADILLSDENVIYSGDFDIGVIRTPGHTAGSMSYLVNKRFLFSGDTLFKNSIGRCFSLSDLAVEKRNIREKLFSLDDDTIVFPGHGDITTIGEEKKWNRYIKV